jgi:hypothetical protein
MQMEAALLEDALLPDAERRVQKWGSFFYFLSSFQTLSPCIKITIHCTYVRVCILPFLRVAVRPKMTKKRKFVKGKRGYKKGAIVPKKSQV